MGGLGPARAGGLAIERPSGREEPPGRVVRFAQGQSIGGLRSRAAETPGTADAETRLPMYAEMGLAALGRLLPAVTFGRIAAKIP